MKMAIGKMSTFTFIVFACALAGLCLAEDKDCSTDAAQVFPKVVSCITDKHPEYIFTVLTRMKEPSAMADPNFMCSQQGLMSAVLGCFLQYVKGCMPSSMADQVAEVLPTDQTIQKGVRFLCAHRDDFNDQCVQSRLTELANCIRTKMQTYTRVSRSVPQAHKMQDALCFALQEEEQCLDKSLADCPSKVITDIKSALRAFFPSDKCPRTLPRPEILLFQSEGRH